MEHLVRCIKLPSTSAICTLQCTKQGISLIFNLKWVMHYWQSEAERCRLVLQVWFTFNPITYTSAQKNHIQTHDKSERLRTEHLGSLTLACSLGLQRNVAESSIKCVHFTKLQQNHLTTKCCRGGCSVLQEIPFFRVLPILLSPLHYSASYRTSKCPTLIHYPMHTPPFLKLSLCNFLQHKNNYLILFHNLFFFAANMTFIYIYLQFMHNIVCVYIGLCQFI